MATMKVLDRMEEQLAALQKQVAALAKEVKALTDALTPDEAKPKADARK